MVSELVTREASSRVKGEELAAGGGSAVVDEAACTFLAGMGGDNNG